MTTGRSSRYDLYIFVFFFFTSNFISQLAHVRNMFSRTELPEKNLILFFSNFYSLFSLSTIKPFNLFKHFRFHAPKFETTSHSPQLPPQYEKRREKIKKKKKKKIEMESICVRLDLTTFRVRRVWKVCIFADWLPQKYRRRTGLWLRPSPFNMCYRFWRLLHTRESVTVKLLFIITFLCAAVFVSSMKVLLSHHKCCCIYF